MNPEPISERYNIFLNNEAIRLAAELYGLNVAAQKLPGEYDHNFHLSTDNGAEYVLKVMHAERERDLIELQCQAFTHLATHAPLLQLQRVCPTLQGELLATAKTDDGAEHLVWLLQYVPGDLLAQANPHTPELLFSLGSLLGEFGMRSRGSISRVAS